MLAARRAFHVSRRRRPPAHRGHDRGAPRPVRQAAAAVCSAPDGRWTCRWMGRLGGEATGDAGPTGGRPGGPEVSGADVRAPQDSEDAGPARAAASQPMGTGASNDNPDGADVEAGLGSSSAPQRSEPTPARVRQALAAVSRETGRLTPPAPIRRFSRREQQCRDSAVPDSTTAVPDSWMPHPAVPETQWWPNQQRAGRRLRVRNRWPFLLFPMLRPIRR